MRITNLNQFLHSYFLSHQCEIIENYQGVLTVQLTEELDKSLMNRPFYWHYIKSIGQTGEPKKLTLITNPDQREVNGEWIHFGSPRLQQILKHLKNNNKYIRLFQHVNTTKNTALHPWLLINIQINYQGKQKKDELFSVGLNLVTGMMKLEMMKMLQNYQLNMSISDYCYVISPLIKYKSGYARIESVVDNYINNQEHHWADESLQSLEEEIKMLEHFYHDEDHKEQKHKEIKEITDRYTPVISHEVINGGIIYLLTE